MTKTQLRRIPAYLFLSVAVVLSVFPLYFMAVSATNTSNEVLASRLLPGSHLLENFQTLVDSQPSARRCATRRSTPSRRPCSR